MESLGSAYVDENRFREAISLFRESLLIQQRTLPLGHTNTVNGALFIRGARISVLSIFLFLAAIHLIFCLIEAREFSEAANVLQETTKTCQRVYDSGDKIMRDCESTVPVHV